MKMQNKQQASKHAIKNLFAVCFAVFMLISFLVWIVGLLTAITFPWFGGVKADKVGQIGFSVGLIGESCVWIFAWLWKFV
jgi:hypothetical protein